MSYDNISDDMVQKAIRLGPTLLGFQFIWWGGERQPFFFHRFVYTGLRLIYRWTLCLGWFEVRRWRFKVVRTQ